jgi:hypothetical protein
LLELVAEVCFLCVDEDDVEDDEELCDQHAADSMPATTKTANLSVPEKKRLTAESHAPAFTLSRKERFCCGFLHASAKTFLFMH